MTYQIPQGVQVSLDYNPSDGSGTWYKLSDHNRQPIGITYNLIEATDRMANGTLRKYIVARKFVITANWKDLPSLDSNVVDYTSGAKGAAWIKAFYEGNAFQPVYVKLVFAQEGVVKNSLPDGNYVDSKNSAGQIYNAYMTTFTYDVTKRMRPTYPNQGYDYVDLKIEFTEI
jgi:hypothetical protein